MAQNPRKGLILTREVLSLGGWKTREDMYKDWDRMWAKRGSYRNMFMQFCAARHLVRSEDWIHAKVRKKR